MSQKPLSEKLLIKEGYRVLLVDNPADYQTRLSKLPSRVTISTNPAGACFDLIQAFFSSKNQLEEQLPKIMQLMEKKGLLWITYPKGKTEINRDTIRELASTIGVQAVSLVAVDETWSALRLKKV